MNPLLTLLFCPLITTSNNLSLKIYCENTVDITVFINLYRYRVFAKKKEKKTLATFDSLIVK